MESKASWLRWCLALIQALLGRLYLSQPRRMAAMQRIGEEHLVGAGLWLCESQWGFLPRHESLSKKNGDLCWWLKIVRDLAANYKQLRLSSPWVVYPRALELQEKGEFMLLLLWSAVSGAFLELSARDPHILHSAIGRKAHFLQFSAIEWEGFWKVHHGSEGPNPCYPVVKRASTRREVKSSPRPGNRNKEHLWLKGCFFPNKLVTFHLFSVPRQNHKGAAGDET